MTQLIQLLKEKSLLKQDIFEICQLQFSQLKEVLEEIEAEVKQNLGDELDKRLHIRLEHIHEFESRLYFGGDVLVFTMHSNIFKFPHTHEIYKKDYIKEDPDRGFCGSLYIHNFLADSFKYSRFRDPGLLVGRVFFNHDQHFFVEGQRKLGFLFNSIETMELNKVYWNDIVQSAMQFAIEFDLEVPVYNDVQVMTVGEKLQQSGLALSTTSKPLGFVYQGKDLD